MTSLNYKLLLWYVEHDGMLYSVLLALSAYLCLLTLSLLSLFTRTVPKHSLPGLDRPKGDLARTRTLQQAP